MISRRGLLCGLVTLPFIKRFYVSDELPLGTILISSTRTTVYEIITEDEAEQMNPLSMKTIRRFARDNNKDFKVSKLGFCSISPVYKDKNETWLQSLERIKYNNYIPLFDSSGQLLNAKNYKTMEL